MITKIDIISGFLGAGKTTLIKKLLDEELQQEKVAIIENEFGQVGIDGKLFKGHNVKIQEINSGCICCSLQGDFSVAVEEILRKHKPDRIIIEPSGVGKLSDILQTCLNPRFQHLTVINMVIVVVDAMKFDMYLKNFGEFFKDQLEHAKTIILSRTQNISGDCLESVTRRLHAINSSANLMTTPWNQISTKNIMSLAEGNHNLDQELSQILVEFGHTQGHVHQHGGEHCHCHHHEASDVFTSWGVETSRRYSVKEVSEILEQLRDEKFGRVIRSKGILPTCENNWLQFDYISGEISIKPTTPDYNGLLCVIGKDIDSKKLGELFKINQS